MSAGGLLAAGYAACIENAVIRIAGSHRGARADEVGIEALAVVSFPPDHHGGVPSSISLDVHVVGLAQDSAEQIVRMALAVCPYTIALDSEVAIELSVTTG